MSEARIRDSLPASLRALCAAMAGLALLTAAGSVVAFLMGGAGSAVIDETWQGLSEPAQAAVTYTDGKKRLLHLVSGLSMIGSVLVMTGAAYAFAAMARGPVFSVRTAGRLRLFAVMVFLSAALSLIAPTLLTLVMTIDNPPGLRVLTVSAGTPQVIGLLTGLFLVVMAHVLTEATRLADENRSFV